MIPDPKKREPPKLWKLRPQVVSEIEAFLDWGESDFGLSSNFTPLLNRAMSGGGGSAGRNHADDTMCSRLRLKFELDKKGNFVDSSVAIQRAVRAAFMALTEPFLTVLVARHKYHPWPPELTRAFGDVAGVVLLTSEAALGYAAAPRGPKRPPTLQEWLLEIAKAYDETAVEPVRDGAEKLVFEAHLAYSALREPAAGTRGCGAFRARAQRRSPRKFDRGIPFLPGEPRRGWR